MPENPVSSDAMRLDAWLWAARFYKTRSLAKSAIESGQVEVGGERAKPSRAVRAGDVLRVTRGDDNFEVSVLALASRRGSATQAAALFCESEQSRLQRDQRRAQRAAERTGYRAPEGKPDKRARRLIQALGDIDAF